MLTLTLLLSALALTPADHPGPNHRHDRHDRAALVLVHDLARVGAEAGLQLADGFGW